MLGVMKMQLMTLQKTQKENRSPEGIIPPSAGSSSTKSVFSHFLPPFLTPFLSHLNPPPLQ